jgi:hypothetical protein
MPLSLPRLLRTRNAIDICLPVAACADAQQGSFSLVACGGFPMQGLRFTFSAPDGTVLKCVAPRRAAPRRSRQPWRFRATALGVVLDSLARTLLRREMVFHIDLAPEQLRYPALSVRIENVGATAVMVRNPGIRTTPLARDRLVDNTHALEGYSARVSVAAGAFLPLFVHAPACQFSLQVIRRGGTDDIVFSVDAIPGMVQHYRADAFENGARWQLSYMLAIDPAWPSGLYAARLRDTLGGSFDIAFIVTSASLPAPGTLAVLAATNTWQAYNDWGGASLYRRDPDDGLGRPLSAIVHSQRPNPAALPPGPDGHLANAEQHVLGWLDHNAVGHHVFADIDLHERPGLLDPYPALLVNTHSEYWSANMYRALEAFLARGGNLVYLSGNGLYWKTVLSGHRMEVRSDHSCHTLASEPGGRWRDFGRPEMRVLGVRFTRAGYKSTYRPYRVIASRHWIFENTTLVPGDLIGAAGRNCGGASGWELDKIDPAARPPGLVHLAKGTNPWRAGADMVYFPHPGGGAVFSVGSITFGGSLAVDPSLSHMLLNVIARFAAPSAVRAAA